ncbi:MAG: DUF2442 domain-containing protein [Pseudanabaena sp.]
MMNPYVKKVKPLENYCLMLWFTNGEQKIFDLKPYLNKGVFNQLKNTALFASVRVVAGSVEWSNGIDLSYDTLYLEGLAINIASHHLGIQHTHSHTVNHTLSENINPLKGSIVFENDIISPIDLLWEAEQ